MLKFIPVTNYDMVIDGGAVNIRYAASLELLFTWLHFRNGNPSSQNHLGWK